MLDNYLSLQSGRIEVRYTCGDENHARDTMLSLHQACDLLDRYFAPPEAVSMLRAILVPTRKEYERLVVNLLGVQIEIPSNPGRLAQPQKTDLVLLSPSAYAKHSTYVYRRGEYRRLVAHETVHIYEEHLSPDIEKSPLWWGEGLAVYLSGQWRHDDQFRFRQPVVQGVTDGAMPRLERVFQDRALAYDWGWTLVMFIEDVFGSGMVVRAVRECSDGDILAALGQEGKRFELRWREWLLARGRDLIGF